MNTNEFDYYLIEADQGNYPRLEVDDDFEGSANSCVFSYDEEAPDDAVAHLKFGYSEKGFTMPDYLWCDCRAVFSKKIYDVLKDVAIKDFKLVPTIIKGKKSEEYTDYWSTNVYGEELAFLDKDNSKFSRIDSSGRWKMIKSMVIDKELMSQVPLEERLIYTGKESSAYMYYHKSIVDLIMSVNPTGVKFISVEEWMG